KKKSKRRKKRKNQVTNNKIISNKSFISQLEVEAFKVLSENSNIYNINREFKINSRSKKYYDFYVEYNSKKYLLEVDGEQHFKQSGLFHSNLEDFKQQQRRDIKYTKYAIKNGYNIIRIDYTKKGHLGTYINYGLLHSNNHYLSDPNLYSHIKV